MNSGSNISPDPIRPVVIGTAGHVDHGKSTLVRSLTGIDPDRLKEEKARGLTIDIGFANFRHRDGSRVGMVDVPGHERFIKNMVTGATGIDIVILVVAANDGVMQQTREHLQILTLLGKRHGLIAITKADLVDADMLELAEADIREAVAGTFLEKAPSYCISTITGHGMEAFRTGLADLIDSVEPHSPGGAFRLPIQRVFSAKGQGAVLTGIPLSGSVAVGDEVETIPSAQKGKIRHIQAYHGDRERAQAGHSSALNISSIDHKLVERGHVVASPGYARPVTALIAHVRLLPNVERPIRQGTEVKLLIDNSEVVGTLWMHGPGGTSLAPGEAAVCGLTLETPVVPAVGDRFILRLPSPADTVGGGRVVSLSGENIRAADAARREFFAAKALVLDDLPRLAEMTCLEAGAEGITAQALAHALWLRREETAPIAASLLESGTVQQRFVSKLVHRDAWSVLETKILSLLEAHHKSVPHSPGMKEAELQQKSALEPRFLGEVLEGLAARGLVSRVGEVVCHSRYQAKLTPAQESAMARIRQMLADAGFSAPTLEELQAAVGLPPSAFRVVSEYLISRGEAVLVAGQFLYSSASIDRAVALSGDYIRTHGDMKAGDFKTLLDTTRKYAIPLLEYLDGRGTFINRGGVRLLRS